VAAGLASPQLGSPVFPQNANAVSRDWKVTEGNLKLAVAAPPAQTGTPALSVCINTAAGNPHPQDALTGVIESPPFLVNNQFYLIAVAGSNQYEETYVSVCRADTREEVWRSTGNNSDALTTSAIDLSKATGTEAFVRLVNRRAVAGGRIIFGGLFNTDQAEAKAELVTFHINLLNSRHSRAVGEAWLHKNLEARHVPLLENALMRLQNDAIQRVLLVHLGRFPSATSVPALIYIATNANEFRAKDACRILRENLRLYSPAQVQAIEQAATNLVNASPSEDLRVLAAGVLVSLATPTAMATLQHAHKTAPPKVARGIAFLLNSSQFARTSFDLPLPGFSSECWLRGMQYFVYLPKSWDSGKEWPLLVVVHGTDGHGRLYQDLVQAECDRLGVVAIAPTFDPHRFWGFGHFGGKWRPDLALIEAIQSNAPRLHLANKPCLLLGHSEGAQFVGRFALVHPDGVRRVAMSGTDELCWPDQGQIFPFGTGPNPEMPGLPALTADSWLNVPTLLIVGTDDHKANIAISEKWAAAVNDYAAKRGRSERVTFLRNPGGLHSLKSNYPMIQNWLQQGLTP
jgi:pimeloyl-ACP methyl ester carboxylesterase